MGGEGGEGEENSEGGGDKSLKFRRITTCVLSLIFSE